jgi:hypothetical protein
MPRLPKEPAPEMLRTFGPRPSFDPAAHDTGAAPIASPSPSPSPIASPSPSAYRAKNPYQAPPTEYKPPSFLKQHRRLAILFAGVAVAFAFYCFKAPHELRSAQRGATSAGAARPARPSGGQPPPSPSASASQPIYIETVPDKDAR